MPIRKPNIGDEVIYLDKNAYNGMSGVVDWVSDNTPAFSVHTGTSTLVCTTRNAFGKATATIYRLKEDGRTYKNM